MTQRLLKRGLLLVVLTSAVGLAIVNGLVRATGGNPALLSPLYLESKLRALAILGRHLALHPFLDCPADRAELVARAAERHGVPVPLALAIAEVESRRRPHAISRAGAMGMMQLMPATARRLGVEDPFDPEQSAQGGARLLRELWRCYPGDPRRVAAAYNAGPGAVPARGPLRLQGETRIYVAQVEAQMRVYDRHSGGASGRTAR